MKKFAWILGASVVAFAAAAFALQSASGRVATYSETLNKADGLTAQITSVVVGGGRSEYSIELAKPNFARIQTPSTVVVSDGTEIVTYYRAQRMFIRQPASIGKILGAMSHDEAVLFRPFFEDGALKGMSSVRALPGLSKRGMDLEGFQGTLDAASGRVAKMYVDSANLLRQAEIGTPRGGSVILDVTNISLARPAADRFTFKAPAGARETTEAEMNADRWYDNIEEAKKVAAATNRIVLVDFMFEGCVWCARLDADVFKTSEFKDAVKGRFVLAKVDILKDPAQAQPYGVQGAPDIRFLKPDGTEVHKIGGYVPLDRFLAGMDQAWNAR